MFIASDFEFATHGDSLISGCALRVTSFTKREVAGWTTFHSDDAAFDFLIPAVVKGKGMLVVLRARLSQHRQLQSRKEH
jgi:hypothetical protein